MRVALFTPLPPAPSGIADYSQALVEPLAARVDLTVFSGPEPAFDPARFDIALYQIGNNAAHEFVYQTALRHPGVAVLHESNLHHLMTDLTIRRGDWDAYVRECEYEGGPEARAFAERVRRLEVGPDYEGIPMTRRLLERSRAVIVHSRFMQDAVRRAGFSGPVAVIPHGAWIPRDDRNAFRHRLGLDEFAVLVGIFGFLKPYKRIPEALRAFRRLVRLTPGARMILVGEPHPELGLEPMIRSMGLSAEVRVLGFAPIGEFTGYLAACDIVLNLRFPTVGETSGTLQRALGLGKSVLVSDIGAFAELPDEVCLKVPPGAGEEDLIFEYLNLLASRPDLRRELGARARRWVEQECSWERVAGWYAEFMQSVVEGREWTREAPAAPPVGAGYIRHDAPDTAPAPAAPPDSPDLAYLAGWSGTDESRHYLETHQTRLVKTLAMIPPGGPCDRVLEMGAYMQITPALRTRLGYGEVRGCYYGPPGRIDHKVVTSAEGETFHCDIDHFDAEKDSFPYPGGHFSTVLCCELIEHLFADPMHLMCEVNRILAPGGHLVLTTPNIISLRAIAAVLQGYHPGFFHAYLKPAGGGEVDARHNREYTPREVQLLLENSGFEVLRLETGEFRDEPHPEYGWVRHLLDTYWLGGTEMRGDGIFALARKTGPVRERYPGWLYS